MPADIRSLVPMAFVADVPASIRFYAKLGFRVGNTFSHPDAKDGAPTWAWLENGRPQLMLAKASDPVDSKVQGVLFYAYFADVLAAKVALEAEGIAAGPITYPFYAPKGEFRVTDPDGYAIMVTHTEISFPLRAAGPFDVKMIPVPAAEGVGDATIGRFALDKQYHGELEAVSRGEMLAAMTAVEDSAGYVALERVGGALAGRRGTFALQHRGLMNRGEPSLTVTVVPDSGTGELAGLAGKMTIEVAGGKHSYVLEYALAPKP